MIWYEIVEGNNANDYDDAGDYGSMAKALRVAKKSKWPYVRVDKYEGEWSKEAGYDGDYVETIYEKGRGIPSTVRGIV